MAQIQTGFFTHEIQLRRLDKLGDPLKAIGEVIDFEIFRPTLNSLLGVRAAGPGRPPWDRIMMFKILILQLVRGLSDEKLEFALIDSASAQRFVGLSPHDPVPDSRTVWLFRDTLAKCRLPGSDGDAEGAEGIDGARALFDMFRHELAAKGLLCREGRTVDAMIVEVPRQRNPKEENQEIKKGGVPGEWKKQPRKLAQKDTDARWTLKRGRAYYGYKNSIVGGNSDHFIHGYLVAPATAHDSKIIPDCYFQAAGGASTAYGDSAYTHKDIAARLSQAGIESRIHEQRLAGKEPDEGQKESNRVKSKVRARIEHRFGRMRMCLGGLAIRSIGFVRCRATLGMLNLVYNMMEYARLMRRGTRLA